MKRIYFLHGFMGTGQTHFEQQIAYFKKEYDVIVMDLPGHGTSEDAAAVEYIEQATVSLINRIRETGPGHLVGLSLGASLAIQVALKAPELVDGIILTGYTPVVPEELKEVMTQQYTYFLDIKQHEPLIAAQFEDLHGTRWQETMQRVLHQMTFRYPTMTKQSLQHLQAPVFILNGMVQEHEVTGASRFQREYPNTQIHLIPDAGHTANLDQPDLFNHHLNRVLQQSNE